MDYNLVLKARAENELSDAIHGMRANSEDLAWLF